MSPEEQVAEKDVREYVAMIESLKAQLDGLMKQQELIQLAVEEHVRARETVKEMAKGSPGDNILVPLGADSYIHAQISDNRTALVGIGSGVSLRKTPEEAEKILDLRIDDLSRAFKSVADRASQAEALIQEYTEKVQAQYGQLQGKDSS